MPVIRSSIVSKIGYMLQYRGPLTTMVSINTGLRIHKHKFIPAQGMTNIGKQDIPWTKR